MTRALSFDHRLDPLVGANVTSSGDLRPLQFVRGEAHNEFVTVKVLEVPISDHENEFPSGVLMVEGAVQRGALTHFRTTSARRNIH